MGLLGGGEPSSPSTASGWGQNVSGSGGWGSSSSTAAVTSSATGSGWGSALTSSNSGWGAPSRPQMNGDCSDAPTSSSGSAYPKANLISSWAQAVINSPGPNNSFGLATGSSGDRPRPSQDHHSPESSIKANNKHHANHESLELGSHQHHNSSTGPTINRTAATLDSVLPIDNWGQTVSCYFWSQNLSNAFFR